MRRLGIVLGEKGLRASERAIDSFTKLGAVIKKQFMQAVVNVAPEIEAMTDAITDAIPPVFRLAAEMLGLVGEAAKFFGLIDLTKMEKLNQELVAAGRNLRTLKIQQKSSGIGGLFRVDNAERIKKEEANILRIINEQNALREKGKKLQALVDKAAAGAGTGAEKTIATIERIKISQKSLFQLREGGAIRTLAQLEAEDRMLRNVNDDFDAQMEKVRQLADAKKSLFQQREGGILSDAENRSILADAAARNTLGANFETGFQSQFDAMKLNAQTAAQEIGAVFGATFDQLSFDISRGVTDVLFYGKTWTDALKDIGKSLLSNIVGGLIEVAARMAINFAVSQVFGKAALAATAVEASVAGALWATPAALASLATLGANAAPASAGIVSTVSLAHALAAVPGLAEGGDHPVGRPFIVGERGPEVRVEKRPGTIIPNDQIGRGSGRDINVNFYLTILDGESFEDFLIRNRGRLSSFIVEAVNDAELEAA